jgi:dTDP-4-amino-4,6-dideoxygalactose transaminase
MVGVEQCYSYFPILIDENLYGISRDNLYEKLKQNNILGRRYFYPLISDFEPYKNLPSATRENLPIATKVAENVLCLPIFVELKDGDIERITDMIK